ncbi:MULTISPECIES: hypothetical protein [unclassified Endozoicomonas]|uniref:hypothetical protein n=1 Tax=unclassified Endozoicomonas TaxID=2644528 RepID=UPI002148E939|nr:MULTISPECIES: hypothetical protein [unclassified Endozoicomonas]
MRKRISGLIILSVIEKFFLVSSQFLIIYLINKSLGVMAYGLVSAVASTFVFFNVFNVAVENILLRRRVSNIEVIEKVNDYLSFSIIKVIALGLYLFVCYLLFFLNSDKSIIFALLSFFFIQTSDIYNSTSCVYNVSISKQSSVTTMSVYRCIFNIILTVPILYFDSLAYLAMKDFLVLVFYTFLWRAFNPLFRIKAGTVTKLLFSNEFYQRIKSDLRTFSLWSHLNGVVTFFIYKADVFFLSIFSTSTIVGKYSVALAVANLSNILPMILNQQNVVVLSNCKSKSERKKAEAFFKSIYLGVSLLILGLFSLFGSFIISILVNGEVENLYVVCFSIVISLVIMKIIPGLILSRITVEHSLRDMFISVALPSAIFSFFVYLIVSYIWGYLYLAFSNIAVAICWTSLLLLHYKKISRA